MSQWCYKLDEEVIGPVTFQELADRVREGTIAEGVPVTRAGALKWEPAWRIPGLWRAAGIVEPGDSPLPVEGAVERTSQNGTAWSGDHAATAGGDHAGTPMLPGYVPAAVAPPRLTPAGLARGAIAAVAGILTAAFFYRWALQTTTAFPLPPVEVNGDVLDSFFPLIGRCTSFECGMLYVDAFAVGAIAAWRATRRLKGEI